MILRNIREPEIMLNARSCCRCGVEFRALGERVRVCEACRRPRNPARLRVVPGQRLSDRERQVAALVARGLPNKLIASQLHLSEGTIKVYLFHIFQKTKVNNRTELAVWQVRGGISAESQAG
jgi:two-component system nitrate/nitrite response regulator NarL